MRRPLLAVPLDDRNFERNARLAKELGADAIEYRIDAFENSDLNHCQRIIETGKKLGLKGILTIRLPSEGGERLLEDRLRYFEKLAPLCEFTDVELRAPDREEAARVVRCAGSKLILSYHDFERTPPEEELQRIFDEAVAAGADVAKVATAALDYGDVSRLLCVAARQPVATVAIAMGEAGKVSRVAGIAFNSIITYCALERAFAPGQLTLREVREMIERLF